MRRLALLVVFLWACGDPAPPTVSGNGDVGGIIIIGTGGTGGGGAGGSGGAGGTGGAIGACDNDSDLSVIGTGSFVRDVTANCGFQCSTDAEYEFCVNQCLTQQIQNLSLACAGCYSALEQCAVDVLCGEQCRVNPCGLTCLRCEGYDGCVGEFQACSGLAGNGCSR